MKFKKQGCPSAKKPTVWTRNKLKGKGNGLQWIFAERVLSNRGKKIAKGWACLEADYEGDNFSKKVEDVKDTCVRRHYVGEQYRDFDVMGPRLASDNGEGVHPPKVNPSRAMVRKNNGKVRRGRSVKPTTRHAISTRGRNRRGRLSDMMRYLCISNESGKRSAILKMRILLSCAKTSHLLAGGLNRGRETFRSQYPGITTKSVTQWWIVGEGI